MSANLAKRPVLRTLFVVAVALVALAPQATGSVPPGPCEQGDAGIGNDDPRCLDPEPGAECIAYGLLVVVDNAFAGKVVSGHAESRAKVTAVDQIWSYQDPIPPGGHDLNALVDPHAHADAAQESVGYDGLGVRVRADSVHSWCDAAAGYDPRNNWAMTHQAFGRAGVENLTIDMGGLRVFDLDVADFELAAAGTWSGTFAYASCDSVQSITSGIKDCPGHTQLVPPPAHTVVHHNWGPLFYGGKWGYGGSYLHVQVIAAATVVDVYVGFVSVGVSGAAPTPPVDWF